MASRALTAINILKITVEVGLVLGVIGGHLCRIAVTTERAFRLHPGRRVIPLDGPHEPDFMDQLDVRSSLRPRPNARDEYDA